MAIKKEIKEHLKTALLEVGEIKPWFNKDFKSWIFSHPNYPVEYAGDSEKEVIKNYPLYLYDFIKERLDSNLSGLTEKETKGKGGKREGAGRPIGTKKEIKTRIYVPTDIANLLREPGMLAHLRGIMQACHNAGVGV